MLKIAVTGGIACGKSLVGSFLRADGVAVCDADDLAHEVMTPPRPVYRSVVDFFGDGILAGDGSINRGRLAERVFGDAAALERLNAMVHPAVKEAWSRWLAARETDSRCAAVIIPLLYEVGEGEGWDAVVCVLASEEIQRRRVVERGGTAADAARRIRAQMDVRRKAALADFVIVNNTTKASAKEQAQRVLRSILET
jgi:dephospho-CoA kinase